MKVLIRAARGEDISFEDAVAQLQNVTNPEIREFEIVSDTEQTFQIRFISYETHDPNLKKLPSWRQINHQGSYSQMGPKRTAEIALMITIHSAGDVPVQFHFQQTSARNPDQWVNYTETQQAKGTLASYKAAVNKANNWRGY